MSRTEIVTAFALCGGAFFGLYSLGIDRYTVESAITNPAYRSAKWGPLRMFHMDSEGNKGRSMTLCSMRHMHIDIVLPNNDIIQVEL
jgi:hypothetical protein